MTRGHAPVRAVALATVLLSGAAVGASELRPEAIAAWNRYVAAVEQRRGNATGESDRFLLLDAASDGDDERRALLAGRRVVREMDRIPIDVPDALVHHWRGAIFLPGVELEGLVRMLETEAPPPGGEVLRSAVLARNPGHIKVFLRLQRSKIVTVVLDTEHEVRFTRHSPVRASSASEATRIVEIQDPGAASERPQPAGHDRGFLWRLNAYWRYEAVPGGVIAECESISLSRDLPWGLQTIAGPIVGSVARESMERALDDLARRTAGARESGRARG